MKLVHALRLSSVPRLALVGAGGKTTTLFQIAREYSSPVLVTTTTHFALEQAKLGDHHFVIERPDQIDQLESEIQDGVYVITAGLNESGRLTGLGAPALERLLRLADALSIPLLIESDGSRQLPLKAPAGHEPVIPPFVDTVVVVAGLSALGKPLSSQWVHRSEIFSQLSGLELGDEIDTRALASMLVHPEGGLKHIPPGARRIALLNQADTGELQSLANSLSLRRPGHPSLFPAYHAIVIASMIVPSILAVHEPVAAIILAAGGASRFGQPKQLLTWRGVPLIRHIAQIALDSGLFPVLVVSGAFTPEIRQALTGLKVDLTHNPDWQQGQSSSIKTGLRKLPPHIGSVIFLLADQPFISESLFQALVDAHAENLSPIVAPLVQDRRSNPVLFDRLTFNDFASLSGDVGGRALFARYPITWVPWHDLRLLLDVDTPEDYQRLLDMEVE